MKCNCLVEINSIQFNSIQNRTTRVASNANIPTSTSLMAFGLDNNNTTEM